MEIVNLNPKTDFPLLYGLNKSGFNSSVAALGAQQVIQNKEETSGAKPSTRLFLDASKLFSKASSLLPDFSNSVFSAKKATSSKPLAATFTPANDALPNDYEITVAQTMGSQTIRSDTQISNETMDLSRGYFEFSIYNGKDIYDFNVMIDENATYGEAMQAVADAINEADTGISASVVNNYNVPSAYLEIYGISREAMNTANVYDTSGTLMSQLGVKNIQDAGETTGGLEDATALAKFNINGKDIFAQTNSAPIHEGVLFYRNYNIDVEKSGEEIYNEWVDNGGQFKNMAMPNSNDALGIYGDNLGTLDLNGTTEDVANIDVGTDENAIANGIGDFLSALNQFKETLSTEAASGGAQVGGFLSSILANNESSLSELGIVNNSGDWSVFDRNTLESQIRTGYNDIKELFGGTDGIAEKTLFGVKKSLYAPMFSMAPAEYHPGGTSLFNVTGFLVDDTL